jgi:hypothetical protein
MGEKNKLLYCPMCEGKGTLFYFPYPGEADCHYCSGTGTLWKFTQNIGEQLITHLQKIDDPELEFLLPDLKECLDTIVKILKKKLAREGTKRRTLIYRRNIR